MKKSSFLRKSLSAALLTAWLLTPSAEAAPVAWVGDTSNDFMNGANWATDPALPSLSLDTWQVNSIGTQGNSTLNVSSPLIFTATTAKIAFGASSGNMSLSGSDITLFQGTGDGILTAATSGNTTTIGNNIILGNGSVGTNSLSNTGTGLLKMTGSITGGSGGTAGAVTLSLGSTGSQNGNYDISGNITKGGASTITLTKRGNGTASVSGVNVIDTVNNSNEVGSSLIFSGGNTTITTGLNYGSNSSITNTVRVTGGILNLNMADGVNGWGTGVAGSILRVSGGTVNTTSGRAIDPSIVIDGGTLNINPGASRMSFNSANTTLTVSSGALNVGAVTNGARFGNLSGNNAAQTGSGNFTANQSGGIVSVVGAGAATTTFSLGGNDTLSSTVIAYNLSGGTLDVGNSTTNTNGYIQLGANANGNGTTTLALSGTGKLISRFNPATAGGISGAQAGAVQVLSLTGGTLVAGRIDATNLRGSIGDTNGTIINNGSSIAPGDIGSAGKTSITGALTLTSGTLVLDIGGTTAATNWQQVTTGFFDNIAVTGVVTLGGNLSLSLIDAYTPAENSTYTILTGSSVTGTFAGLSNNSTFSQSGQSWKISYNATNVVLTAVPEPATWALLAFSLTTVMIFRRRTRA